MLRAVPVIFAAMALAAAGLVLSSCERATVGSAEGFGAKPALPAPNPGLFPTVNIAPAIGWPAGETPDAADGLTVNEFAGGLDHPRWLHVLPNGDVLVAESNAPAKPDTRFSVKGWVMGKVMARAGAAVPSATASPCCAMRMVTEWLKHVRSFLKISTHHSDWR